MAYKSVWGLEIHPRWGAMLLGGIWIKRAKEFRNYLSLYEKGEVSVIDVIQKYIESFNETTMQRFNILYNLVLESTGQEVEEKLWAKIPSIYRGKNFVRLIPFKDHINIEAKGILINQKRLQGYTITPKGMLQIGHSQVIPEEALRIVFKESLETD